MYISYQHVERSVQLIAEDIKRANIHYDYVAGVVRGGTIPATMLSHKLGVPMFAFNCSLRDHRNTDLSNNSSWLLRSKRVLVVDDIIDSGETVKAIELLAYPNVVDFCCLIFNTESGVKCNYYGMPIERSVNQKWFEFYWE
jgi:hypoxanthine phosphoribosyltransferase